MPQSGEFSKDSKKLGFMHSLRPKNYRNWLEIGPTPIATQKTVIFDASDVSRITENQLKIIFQLISIFIIFENFLSLDPIPIYRIFRYEIRLRADARGLSDSKHSPKCRPWVAYQR